MGREIDNFSKVEQNMLQFDKEGEFYMKKTYIVNYSNDKNGINLRLIQELLSGIGLYKELMRSARAASWILVPEDEAVSAATIKNKIFASLSPFEDSIGVIRVDANDVVCSDGTDYAEFLAKCKTYNGEEALNFSRFKSRHEAYMQYELEKPTWIYYDGIQCGVGIRFDEWCWLPIKKDGMYEQLKYDKYING